jgi:hypothetical protein
VHGLIALVLKALAQAVRCRRDNGAASGTADRFHGTVVPARGADAAHVVRASMGSQGATPPGVVQGAKALPRIQPAQGWEEVKGSGSAPLSSWNGETFPASNRRTVGQGIEGEGVASPPRVQGRCPCRTQTLVCISAPFGHSVHTVGAGMDIGKVELLLTFTRYSGVGF